ncbi:GNAT family N-acetyltransferase [Streptomyces sp. NPDC005574]|uniref:GNAT family N-acetyltransferase n=1 Tax=Streptomyces sp. NPDC005574 TaxID=3156891 RepID=UPI0033BCA033
MIVTRLSEAQLASWTDDLAGLLVDAVDGGASVGFLAPLDHRAAAAWWRERVGPVAAGRYAVWAAHDGTRVVGTVSLAFPDKPNSRHRAELVKLLVHRDARGRGLGRGLLRTAEHAAASAGVTLLHLDTETGSPAESLYRSAGWTRAGVIPDYAAEPGGALRPTTLFYKHVDAQAPGSGTPASGERAGAARDAPAG